jgi:hypothetical protein
MSGTVADNINRQSGVIAEPAGGPEVRSDDPAASEGTVWFNTTSGVLKVYRNAAVWSTVNPLLTSVYANGGAGTASAGLSFGGAHTGTGTTTETEEYDGTSWSVTGVGDLAAIKGGMAAFGTQTAAVAAGGDDGPSYKDTTEEYDGSSWSAGGALNESVNQLGGCGTLTAGMRAGGEIA